MVPALLVVLRLASVPDVDGAGVAVNCNKNVVGFSLDIFVIYLDSLIPHDHIHELMSNMCI